MVDSMGNWGSMVNSMSSSMCNSTKVGESCECTSGAAAARGIKATRTKAFMMLLY